jgi:hypothetical protein
VLGGNCIAVQFICSICNAGSFAVQMLFAQKTAALQMPPNVGFEFKVSSLKFRVSTANH